MDVDERGRNVFQLRPLNLADILDVIVKIYRQHFGQLIGICAVVLAPLGVAQVLISMLLPSARQPENPSIMLALTSPALIVLGLILLLLVAVAMPVMQAATAKAIASYYLGIATSVGEVYRFVLRRWLTLLWVALLIGLVVCGAAAVGMIPMGVMLGMTLRMAEGNLGLRILPAIITALAGLAAVLAITYVSIMLHFGGLIVVLEDSPAVEAMRRSWRLASGHFWRVFGTVAVLGVMVMLAQAIMTYPAQLALMFLGGEDMKYITMAVMQSISVVAQLLTFPLTIAGTVLLYYDLRIRKEGFDLAAMAEAIGEPELAVRTSTGEAAPALFDAASAPPPPPAAQPEETSDGPPDFSDTP